MSQKLNIDLNASFPDVFFGKGVQICGVKCVQIEAGSCISDDVWLNVCIRDDAIRMRIGKCVLIGRRDVISTGGMLEIGDYCILAPNVYVGDVDHAYQGDINVPILMRGTTDQRRLVIEESCWLAMNSVITGALTIGRGSVVGANSVLTRDVLPFTVVAGNPSTIIKMYDPVKEDWIRTAHPDDIKRINDNREKKPLPSRQEYRQILASYDFKQVPPIVAGGEWHI
jgi:acetyltransferase-like isoleucine patch superfamily enzyme